MDSVLGAAAATAPASPGVYFFLDGRATLLYVGKATNIRTRLRQHAKAASDAASPRSVRRGDAVREVRWERWADEHSAAGREADLIVAFRPPMNASIVTEATWMYIVVTPQPGSAVRFTVARAPQSPRGARVYGCFPHLGPGATSRRGIACSDGYGALLRVLWAAGPGPDRLPAHMAKGTPADTVLGVGPAVAPALHRYLSGVSARLLEDLAPAIDRRPEYMRPALRRDLVGAKAFFDEGPRVLRDLRRRHDRPAKPVSKDDIEAMLFDEVTTSIGPFALPALVDPTDGVLGRRASRAHALRAAMRPD